MAMDDGSLSPEAKKPIIVNRPSNFSIDHILNSAGSTREKCPSDCSKSPNDEMQRVYDANTCYLMDNNGHQYPPILDWLHYTRYKPPRLPRKSTNLC